MQRFAKLLAATLLCLTVFAGWAAAAELPALTGRVVDAAGIIDASDEAALVQVLADFETRSSDQIVVATIPSLDGEAIEPFANRLFRTWQLGQAGEDNGVLLVVARDDRKMRIEVGYGLEGTLTDLHSRLIIENALLPAFRSGQFGPGIRDAVANIIEVLSGNAAELEARYKRNAADDDDTPALVWVFVAVWALIFFGSFGLALTVPLFGRKIGPRRYRWLGMVFDFTPSPGGSGRSSGGGFSGGGSSGGGFSGGGGSSGGGGASGSW